MPKDLRFRSPQILGNCTTCFCRFLESKQRICLSWDKQQSMRVAFDVDPPCHIKAPHTMQVYLKHHIVVYVCTLIFFVNFASTDENPFMPKFHEILITLLF